MAKGNKRVLYLMMIRELIDHRQPSSRSEQVQMSDSN